MTEKGKFIVMEGIDGAGTTSQSKRLVYSLRERGVNAWWTCEPTDSPIGILIRQYLARKKESLPSWETMALLFSADRQNHQKAIKAALDVGTWVVCDRYVWSTFAYQLAMSCEALPLSGIARAGYFNWLSRLGQDIELPNLTFYLDVDVDIALKRIAKDERAVEEAFEQRDFLRQVLKFYNYIRESDLLPAVYYNTNDSTEVEVAEELLSFAKEQFKLLEE